MKEMNLVIQTSQIPLREVRHEDFKSAKKESAKNTKIDKNRKKLVLALIDRYKKVLEKLSQR